jgi:hypothetical protein
MLWGRLHGRSLVFYRHLLQIYDDRHCYWCSNGEVRCMRHGDQTVVTLVAEVWYMSYTSTISCLLCWYGWDIHIFVIGGDSYGLVATIYQRNKNIQKERNIKKIMRDGSRDGSKNEIKKKWQQLKNIQQNILSWNNEDQWINKLKSKRIFIKMTIKVIKKKNKSK